MRSDETARVEGLGGVLGLATVALEALVRFEITLSSGFGVLFGVSCAWRHRALLCFVRVYAG